MQPWGHPRDEGIGNSPTSSNCKMQLCSGNDLGPHIQHKRMSSLADSGYPCKRWLLIPYLLLRNATQVVYIYIILGGNGGLYDERGTVCFDSNFAGNPAFVHELAPKVCFHSL